MTTSWPAAWRLDEAAIPTDIRGLSSADTVRLMADSAIELFASIGSSVVCQTVGRQRSGIASGPIIREYAERLPCTARHR